MRKLDAHIPGQMQDILADAFCRLIDRDIAAKSSQFGRYSEKGGLLCPKPVICGRNGVPCFQIQVGNPLTSEFSLSFSARRNEEELKFSLELEDWIDTDSGDVFSDGNFGW
ncbi:hypothetical protein CEXT_617261 [Caerostris extrusa]|uniref:Uncharacterized protein n=1 Tax=Caerostris extrusa TaxID=172846 RepID=A0AAV4XU44_CAEEX|nr:hypothetical protein CEXT_617261 [Caerostris extrusa]